MLEVLARHLAGRMKQAIPDEPVSEAVLRYGWAIVLNTVFTLALSAVFGLALGKLAETMTVLFAFALLRAFTGGYHFKSGTICVVVSSATAAALTLIQPGGYLVLTMTVVSGVLVALYAPAGIERQTRIPVAYHPLLKVVGLLLVLTNLRIQSDLLALSWFVQSISLITLRPRKEVITNEQKST